MRKIQIRADRILRQIARRHKDELFLTEVKNGPTLFGEGLLIMDAVAVKKSWKKPCITGYEIKTSRQDFLRDNKWPYYLKYCHRLYFACPAGLIAPEEVPEDVGLIYYNPEKDCIHTKRAAAFRDIEIPWKMLYYMLICRSKSDRHPFFSSQREYLEAWVQDKAERKELGWRVRNKMTEKIEELTKRVRDLEFELSLQKREIEVFKRVKDILARYDVNIYNGEIERSLENVLSRGTPPVFRDKLRVIAREVEKLMKLTERITCLPAEQLTYSAINEGDQ
ncbi:MmcB family DNA repair protein [Desulfofundulus salinus]|nr:MmcB family DNA repair protein [Desulfofundulus salinum]